MKVTLEKGLGSYTGRYGELVYCHVRSVGLIYSRRMVYPELTEQNAKVGKISSRIYGLKPSEGYKLDLGYYLLEYNAMREYRDKPLRSWSSLYLKLMYRMAELMPEIDLRTLSREEIFASGLPCRSVTAAINAGLIPPVPGWERLDREM